MIIKILGIVIVMISSSLLGMCFSECMTSREKELRNLADAIGKMADELDYTLEAVKFLFKKTLVYTKGTANNVFKKISTYIDEGKGVSEAWKLSIQSNRLAMCITKNDYDVLINNSDAFCANELNQQKALLKGLQSRITLLADSAFEFSRKNSRLAQSIGIYGGIFICAVLF